MTPELTLGLIGIGVAILLILLGIHVGIALGVTGLIGILLLTSSRAALPLMAAVPYDMTTQFAFTVVPMYVLMGEFAFQGGLATLLFEAAHKWMARLQGGLPMAIMVAGAGLAAVTGSSMAAAATLTRSALPELLRYKVDRGLSVGTIAAAGSLAVLIPPSAVLVIYGIIGDQPIGPLLIAGIIPGLLSTVLYMLQIWLQVRIFKVSGGFPPPPTTISEKIRSTAKTYPVVLLIILVLGGLYVGVFTPTESGAVGAVGALGLAILYRQMTIRSFVTGARNAVMTTSMLYLVIIGAFIFSKFLALSTVTTSAIQFFSTSGLSKEAVLWLVLAIYLPLGCVMEAVGMIAVTVPVALPILLAMGYDGVWFGILVVKLIEVAVLTPPVALNVFAVQATAKQIGINLPLGFIYKACFPFVLNDLIVLALLVAFPQIALWLPSQVYSIR